jgi:acyl-[acyl-carrier-protein]-phospholipid O-acyltransferase/long-chain-fatty-acid--[acyl-carrier-protein] ligase
MKRMIRCLLRPALRAVLGLLFRVRVCGMADASRRPLLVVANHESFLDGLLLGLFLPLDPVFVVHTTIAAHPGFRLLLAMVDYMAVDPTSPMAIKTIVRLVQSGRPVVIFPEGRITVTGSLMKVYDGPSFVAAKTGAAILPVRLDGTARTLFARQEGHYPRRLLPRITLSLLPLRGIPMPEAATARERRRLAGAAMQRLMQDMLFESRPMQTLYEGLLDAVAIFGRRHALIEDMNQQEMDYGTVLKMTLALGRMLERETDPGERVGVLLPNTAPLLGVILGLSARGRSAALLNYTAGVEGMQSALDTAQISRIVSSRQFLDKAGLQAAAGQLRGVQLLYLEDLRAGFDGMDKLWLLGALLWPRGFAQARDPEAAAVVLFTSGSEGKPKGVVLSHRALTANVAQMRAVIDFSPADKVMNALPLFHSFGLTAGALMPLLTGVRLFLYPSPLHYKVIPEVIYDRGCSILFGTGTFLANYARHAHPYDFHRLRHVIAGAEKLQDSVRRLWQDKFGIRILEGYGATETAPVLAVNTPMAFLAGSVGQLLPGIEARLFPVPGVARGGLLHVRGPNLMSGYLKADHPGMLQPPVSEAGPGWYDTGDVVELDAEGFVHITGRVKRFAKVAGEMIPLEVVEAIARHARPDAQHAATAVPDAARGEALVLFTTIPDLGREGLQEAARALGHPELAVPRRIQTVDGLPLLGTGKVDYVRLKQLALATAAGPTSGAGA